MSIILKYKEIKYDVNTILWDRDSYFIDFNSYWSRLTASIAQKVAENTTENWNNFNQVRTQVIKFLGINVETSEKEEASIVNVIPTNTYPMILSSGLRNLFPNKNLSELNDLFQTLVDKALKETQSYIRDSIIVKNLNIVGQINNKAKQIIVTNDSRSNNDIFLKEANLTYINQALAEINKEQLGDLLDKKSILITRNTFLKNSYLKREIKNVLLVEDINNISFSDTTKNELITIYIDGASRGNPGPSSIGIAFYKDKEFIDEASEFIGNQTNNFAEYTALIRALSISLEKGYKNIEVRADSELVVNQINKIYKVKDADIKDLFDKSQSLINNFLSFKIIHVPREENLRADKLANKALK